jgi:hypothetical protein
MVSPSTIYELKKIRFIEFAVVILDLKIVEIRSPQFKVFILHTLLPHGFCHPGAAAPVAPPPEPRLFVYFNN